jgi:hypothetical protein
MNEGGTFALGARVANDTGSGGLSKRRGFVGGTVVDDEDTGEGGSDAANEVVDAGRLVKAGDDHATDRPPVHGRL